MPMLQRTFSRLGDVVSAPSSDSGGKRGKNPEDLKILTLHHRYSPEIV